MQTVSRLQEARRIEAWGRARALGVRVDVVEPARRCRTRSQSRPGDIYTLARTGAGWTCTCDGFRFTSVCKHLG